MPDFSDPMYDYYDRLEASKPRATLAQLASLREMGIRLREPVSFETADLTIKENIDQWNALPPTDKQKYTLREASLWRDDMRRGEAAEMIRQLREFRREQRLQSSRERRE